MTKFSDLSIKFLNHAEHGNLPAHAETLHNYLSTRAQNAGLDLDMLIRAESAGRRLIISGGNHTPTCLKWTKEWLENNPLIRSEIEYPETLPDDDFENQLKAKLKFKS